MTSHYNSQIIRLQREIAQLDRVAVTCAKKEADLIARRNRVTNAVNRSTNNSSIQAKLRELERVNKSLADIKKKQSDNAARRAQKAKSLLDYQNRKSRAETAEQKKLADHQRRLLQEREAYQHQISLDTGRYGPLGPAEISNGGPEIIYDFFICHASEDKDEIVRELAGRLKAEGVEVWYDEFTLKVGDRLRREIDRGLRASKFGIVVISVHFFAKEWPQKELDGLFSLDTGEKSLILPIWHRITKDQVRQHSPMLAGIVALNTGIHSIDDIVNELLSMVA